MDRLREIREREAKATKGPWNVWDGPSYVGGGKDLCIGAGETWLANMDERKCQNYAHHIGCHDEGCKVEGDCNICSCDEGITAEQQATADFIAHAREDVPWLLDQLAERDAELVRLREANERYVATLTTIRFQHHGLTSDLADKALRGEPDPKQETQ